MKNMHNCIMQESKVQSVKQSSLNLVRQILQSNKSQKRIAKLWIRCCCCCCFYHQFSSV